MIAFPLFLLVVLAVFSLYLAAVEAAYYLLKRRRLSHVAQQNPRVDMVNRYLEDPSKLLMPIHMGTYIAHLAMTVIITSLLLRYMEAWATLAAFVAMCGYLLLFRLSVPYMVVRKNPERVLLTLFPLFDAYARALAPVMDPLRRRIALRSSLEPPDSTAAEAGPVAPEVPPTPVLEKDEARLVETLDQFAETTVRQVMTPRPDVVSIAASGTVGELRRVMRETKYSRLPVYGENVDDIVGYVEIRDLLDYEAEPEEPLRPLVRDALLVPATKRIPELLREMQGHRTTFAVVIDEYGGTAGLVTMEDILEELVGEIQDEFDVDGDLIAVEGDGSVVVSGRVDVTRLEHALETELDGPGDEIVGTVGGLVTTIFGRVPRPGDRLEYKGFEVEVLDAERKRVNRVRFRRIPVPDPA